MEITDTNGHAFYLQLQEKVGFIMNYHIKRLILEIVNSMLKLTDKNCNDDAMFTTNCFCMLIGAKQLNAFNELKN